MSTKILPRPEEGHPYLDAYFKNNAPDDEPKRSEWIREVADPTSVLSATHGYDMVYYAARRALGDNCAEMIRDAERGGISLDDLVEAARGRV